MNRFLDYLKCGSPQSFADRVKVLEKQFPALGDECRGYPDMGAALCFAGCISRCVWMIYDRHFGFYGEVPAQQAMEKGVQMALTYFRFVGERLAKARAGMRWDKEVAWFEPYSQALLMATLGGLTQERRQLSEFLQPKLVVETVAIPIEAALGDVLLCVAGSLQSSPMDTAPIAARLQKCRKQRPKLLFKAWRALEAGDRATFASTLADSTANYAKTTADDHRMDRAIALLESILATLALKPA